MNVVIVSYWTTCEITCEMAKHGLLFFRINRNGDHCVVCNSAKESDEQKIELFKFLTCALFRFMYQLGTD